MRLLRRWKRALLAAGLATLAPPALGAPVCEALPGGRCLYVDPARGKDGNSGAFDAPLRRPQAAVRLARPGDVIYLRGGIYTADHAYPVRDRATTSGPARRFVHIGDVRAGGENWSPASGTEKRPITLKGYPGEKAHARNAGIISIGSLRTETAWWNIEDLTLEGGCIHIYGGSRGADGKPAAQTHHIAVRGCEVFDFREENAVNAGLIKIDRGDWGGPSHILIENNRLHGLYALGCRKCLDPPGGVFDWKTTRDWFHYGAVTTLSCESYVDPACGGNGALTLRKNVLHDVPMILFFKNPTRGPVVVEDNVFYNARALGRVAGSNTRVEGNVAHGIPAGFTVGGFGGSTARAVHALSGRNFVLRRNTLVGIDEVVRFREHGSGHVIRGNAIVGLTQRAGAAHFDTPGYISRYLSEAEYEDRGAALPQSELAKGNDFNDNCLVSPHPDFIAVSRYLPRDASGRWPIQFLTLSQARQVFGFETRSRVVLRSADPAGLRSLFADPDRGDFRPRPGSPCEGFGAGVSSLSRYKAR